MMFRKLISAVLLVTAAVRCDKMVPEKGASESEVSGGMGTELPQWEAYPGLKSDVLPGWMELPAVSEIEGCAWVYHDMVIPDVYTGRNYSIFYDASLPNRRHERVTLRPRPSTSTVTVWPQIFFLLES